jgi:hypothetical protein
MFVEELSACEVWSIRRQGNLDHRDGWLVTYR